MKQRAIDNAPWRSRTTVALEGRGGVGRQQWRCKGRFLHRSRNLGPCRRTPEEGPGVGVAPLRPQQFSLSGVSGGTADKRDEDDPEGRPSAAVHVSSIPTGNVSGDAR
jgi:hypothetical protein